MRAALVVAAVLGAAVSASGAGVRGSDSASDVSVAQFRQAQLDQVQATIKELDLVRDESARLVQEANALRGQLSAAPDGVTMDWACFGKCNAREQLLCAQFAMVPVIGPVKVAACVALIATKCGLECK
jgi:hypothetical protein